MNSYLFYDLETSGLNKAFDQVLQFAAIRTDMNLNEIQQYNFLIKLRPDIIISPYALITHRISLNTLPSGMCEFEAARRIHDLLNEPGTISLGYNTLGFDDEFLRFMFHRNLLSPYTHQYDRGCRRMDLYPLAIMFFLFKNDIISWPALNGQPSLKLENLNAANHLTSGMAHDALVDVKATLALARCFKKESAMWDYLTGCFVKELDRQRMAKLPPAFSTGAGQHLQALLVDGEFGAENKYQIPVLYIGNSIPYTNQTLWLRMDSKELQRTKAETIQASTWVVRKRLGEPGILLPPLERYWRHLTPERSDAFHDNLAWLKSHPDIFQSIVLHYQQFRYPEIPDLDADAILYQMGFLSRDEQTLCREFHAAPPDRKKDLIDRFPGDELRTLGTRIMARNFPEFMSETQAELFKTYMTKVNPASPQNALMDYKGDARTTPISAMKDILELKDSDNLDNEQRTLLSELEAYIRDHFGRAKT